MDRDVTARIGKARVAFVMLKNIWASKKISPKTKLRIFSSNMYGSETWRKTKKMLLKIQTFINTCLRHIYSIRWPEMISNEVLWEQAGQEPVAKQQEEVGLDWTHPPEAGSHAKPYTGNRRRRGEEEERPASQQLEARH